MITLSAIRAPSGPSMTAPPPPEPHWLSFIPWEGWLAVITTTLTILGWGIRGIFTVGKRMQELEDLKDRVRRLEDQLDEAKPYFRSD